MQRVCNGGVLVETINAFPRRRVRQPVRVDPQRNRRVFVPELIADVCNRLTRLQQQRRECVPHLMGTATVQFGLVENLIAGLPRVRLIERRARGRRNTQSGRGRPCFDNSTVFRPRESRKTARSCGERSTRRH